MSMALTDSEPFYDILVIGGGPAGLSMGHELKRLGISFAVLERGPTAGESWRQMPTNLKLVSPWKANHLPGSRPKLFPRHHEISRREFHRYLNDYAQQHALPVQTNASVNAVTQDANGEFQVRTAQGTFRSRLLVNATGYFSKPFVPVIPGATESAIPQLHVAEYRDPEQIKKRFGDATAPVLIVGQRLSAGQTLVELGDAGLDVALSHRSPLEFSAGSKGLWFFLRILLELEAIKLLLLGSRARDWDVKMHGGRAKRLIQSGAVKTFPAIRRFEHRSVLFENEEALQPAVVIYATGFRPALDHLRVLLPEFSSSHMMPALRGMESATLPGLFFLGLAHQRNFQSRYLRGIRRDAVVLAEQLRARLHSLPRSRAQRPIVQSGSSVVVP